MEVLVPTPKVERFALAVTGSHGRGESVEQIRGRSRRPVSLLLVLPKLPPERFAVEGLQSRLKELAKELGHPSPMLESMEVRTLEDGKNSIYYFPTAYMLDGDAVEVKKRGIVKRAFPQRVLDSVLLLGDVEMLKKLAQHVKEALGKSNGRKAVRKTASLFWGAIPHGVQKVRRKGEEHSIIHWMKEEGYIKMILEKGEGLVPMGPKVILRALQFWALYEEDGKTPAKWIDALPFTCPTGMALRLRKMGEAEVAESYLFFLNLYLDMVLQMEGYGAVSKKVDTETFERRIAPVEKGRERRITGLGGR